MSVSIMKINSLGTIDINVDEDEITKTDNGNIIVTISNELILIAADEIRARFELNKD